MLTLTNPKYVALLKLGKSTRWTNKNVELPILESKKTNEMHLLSKIDLYEDQLPVVLEAMDYTASLIEAQTGAGKTVMAIALHEAWGGRTLVACHSLVLAKQFAEEFTKFTGIEPTFFCNGKHDQTGEVVITTHATLRKQEFNDIDNLAIDEADLMITEKAVKAIIEFKATRKVGFTGTTKCVYDDCNRSQAPVLGKFWGKHIKHTSDKEIPLKYVKVHKYTKTYPDVFPHQDFIEFRKVLDDDLQRKKEQVLYILQNAPEAGYSLALWDRVADVEAFYENFKERGLKVYMSTGQMNKTDREQHLKDFKKTGGYLFGVSSTLNRGYDNKLLTKAFIMHPLKGESPLRQSIGRIMRHLDGKESTLYLWSDSMLAFQLEAQRLIIKKFFNLDIS
jgi:superfamily II DNA or RNA helicase